MVRKKQHNDGLVDGNIHSKKRPSTTKFQYPKIIDECVAENFTMRESRLLAKELDYALDQIEMRSLDSEISKFTNSVTD